MRINDHNNITIRTKSKQKTRAIPEKVENLTEKKVHTRLFLCGQTKAQHMAPFGVRETGSTEPGTMDNDRTEDKFFNSFFLIRS